MSKPLPQAAASLLLFFANAILIRNVKLAEDQLILSNTSAKKLQKKLHMLTGNRSD